MPSIAAQILHVRQRIDAACASVERDPAGVTLIGVSKTVGRAEIEEAYAAGLRDFGENRVQDALSKLSDDWPADATRHLIGSLQTNKVGQALKVFDIVHTVDRPSLVAELRKQAAKNGRTIPVLMQINVARETQKNGCEPEDAPDLAGSITEATELELRGLMTMAPLVDDPEEVRSVFAGLRTLRDEIQEILGRSLPELSMGMTNDFEVAVQEGATMVRIGRAIFVPDQV